MTLHQQVHRIQSVVYTYRCWTYLTTVALIGNFLCSLMFSFHNNRPLLNLLALMTTCVLNDVIVNCYGSMSYGHKTNEIVTRFMGFTDEVRHIMVRKKFAG